MEDNEVHDLYDDNEEREGNLFSSIDEAVDSCEADDDEVRDQFVEDEGDEDNLGVPIKDGAEDYDDRSTIDDDVVKLDEELLDDSEYNDNSFDCD